MKKQINDWSKMDQINSHKSKVSTGQSNWFMNLQVHLLYFCGQVASSVLLPTLSVLKIQVIFILVSCFLLSMQWLAWWVSIKICKVRQSWEVSKISFLQKPSSSEVELKANWMRQNWLSVMSSSLNWVRKFPQIWESSIPKAWKSITHHWQAKQSFSPGQLNARTTILWKRRTSLFSQLWTKRGLAEVWFSQQVTGLSLVRSPIWQPAQVQKNLHSNNKSKDSSSDLQFLQLELVSYCLASVLPLGIPQFWTLSLQLVSLQQTYLKDLSSKLQLGWLWLRKDLLKRKCFAKILMPSKLSAPQAASAQTRLVLSPWTRWLLPTSGTAVPW